MRYKLLKRGKERKGSYTAYTFADSLVWLSYNDGQSTSTRDQEIRKKVANDGNYQFHCGGGRLLDCDQRSFYYSLPALYDTGTVSVDVGSSTCTGSGTTFTAAMKGRYIRIAGQYTQFIITGYSSPTSITIQPTLQSTLGYIGPQDLDDQTYQITQDRVVLPDNFRTIYKCEVDWVPQYLMGGYTRDQIMYARKYGRDVSFPRGYAMESDANLTTASQISQYLMLYPPANQQMNMQVFVYLWPNVCTSGTDEFGVGTPGQPMPEQYYPVLRQFQLALLRKVRNDPQWQAEMEIANKMCSDILGDRMNQDVGQRSMWNLSGDDMGFTTKMPVPFGNVLAPS